MSQAKKLTLKGLAELAGVSTSTVSRALQDNPLIKAETRQRLQALAKAHNFSLNRAASRLRTQKTNVVAVILNFSDDSQHSISDPFLLGVVGELNQALNQKGYELLLSNSLMATDDWANYFISSSRADGLIVVGQGKTPERIEMAVDAKAPLVVWGDPTGETNYPVVGSDNELGGYLAAKHLIDGGCKKPVFLGDLEHGEVGKRFEGYCRAMAEKGIEVADELKLPTDITSTAAYDKVTEVILQKGLYFDGIVAASDMMALGAIKALKERYINIPGDVAIIGFDDIAMAELFHPSLTTIRQNTKEAAQAMVELLLQRFNGEPGASRIIDIELIERKSAR